MSTLAGNQDLNNRANSITKKATKTKIGWHEFTLVYQRHGLSSTFHCYKILSSWLSPFKRCLLWLLTWLFSHRTQNYDSMIANIPITNLKPGITAHESHPGPGFPLAVQENINSWLLNVIFSAHWVIFISWSSKKTGSRLLEMCELNTRFKGGKSIRYRRASVPKHNLAPFPMEKSSNSFLGPLYSNASRRIYHLQKKIKINQVDYKHINLISRRLKVRWWILSSNRQYDSNFSIFSPEPFPESLHCLHEAIQRSWCLVHPSGNSVEM